MPCGLLSERVIEPPRLRTCSEIEKIPLCSVLFTEVKLAALAVPLSVTRNAMISFVFVSSCRAAEYLLWLMRLLFPFFRLYPK